MKNMTDVHTICTQISATFGTNKLVSATAEVRYNRNQKTLILSSDCKTENYNTVVKTILCRAKVSNKPRLRIKSQYLKRVNTTSDTERVIGSAGEIVRMSKRCCSNVVLCVNLRDVRSKRA